VVEDWFDYIRFFQSRSETIAARHAGRWTRKARAGA
jgi:hypothetical protein